MASVTLWLSQLDSDQEEALRKIHAHYWPQLVSLAARRLREGQRRSADDEDIAQEAFIAFCERVRAGGSLRLDSRAQLIALLTTIVRFKAINQYHHDQAQVRGGGKVLSMPVDDAGRSLDPQDRRQVSAEERQVMQETYERYLNALSELLQPVGEMYLAGLSAQEISEQLKVSKRTAERRIKRVTEIWRELGKEDLIEAID